MTTPGFPPGTWPPGGPQGPLLSGFSSAGPSDGINPPPIIPGGITDNIQTLPYTIQPSDVVDTPGVCIVMNLAMDGDLLIPGQSLLPGLQDGDVVWLWTIGNGIVTVQATGTILSPYGKVQLATRYARGMLVYQGDIAPDNWSLEGNLA